MRNQRFKKYFSPEEAKQTLPLVRQIVEDLLVTGQRIRKYLQSQHEIDHNDPIIKPLLDKLDEYHHELQELGCFFKDWNYEIGLVDFPSIINDEEVFLCWRSDEEALMYYHGINDRYAGRKKILPEHFKDWNPAIKKAVKEELKMKYSDVIPK